MLSNPAIANTTCTVLLNRLLYAKLGTKENLHMQIYVT